MFGFGKKRPTIPAPTHSPNEFGRQIVADPSGFLKYERPGEFSITADITADVWWQNDEAMTEDDAKALFIERVESGFIPPSPAKTITNVQAVPLGPMYLVRRDGEDIQTSHRRFGDKPREAIASDFW